MIVLFRVRLIFFWPKLLKTVGYMFVGVGIWSAYMCVRYIYELSVGHLGL